MHRIKKWFYYFCLYLTFILCCNIFLISLVTVENRKELISGSTQNVIFFCAMLLFTFSASIFCVWMYRRIPAVKGSYSFTAIGMFAMILILQILFLFLVSHPMQTSDAATVQSQSLDMFKKQKGRLNMEIPYFQDYTNNHFIVVLFYYFYSILDYWDIHQTGVLLVIFNVICLDTGILFSYLSIRRVKNPSSANFFLLLCLFCPTTYVWETYAYTNTFSIPFVTGVLYLYLCIRKRQFGKRTAVLCIVWGIFAVVGYLLRPTTILPVIAIVLYEGMRYFQLKKDMILKTGIALAACAITFLSCQLILDRHIPVGYSEKAFPITHWIMMGLKGDGGFSLEDRHFTESFSNREERKNANIKEIKKRLSHLGVTGYLELLEKKLERVWARGGDDAFYKSRYAQEYPVLYDYFFGSKNIGFVMYVQVFRAITFFLICMSIFRQIRKKAWNDIFLFTLTLLGAILFFLIWEANPKYNICFLFSCLLLAADGTGALYAMQKKQRRKKWKKIAASGCLIAAGSCLVTGSVLSYSAFAKGGGKGTSRTYFSGTHDTQSVQIIHKTPWVQEQTIQEGQSLERNQWNLLQLYFQVEEPRDRNSNNKEYRIELLSNPKREILYRKVIGLRDLDKNDSYCIRYEGNGSSGIQSYSLRLTHLGKSYGFWTRVTRYPFLDMYPYGRLSINGEKTDYDLCFQLLKE